MLIVKEGTEMETVADFASQYGGKVVAWQPVMGICDIKFEKSDAKYIVNMHDIFEKQEFVEMVSYNSHIDVVPQTK